MPLIFSDVLKELKGGKYRPIYLLMGEEPFPIDEVSDYIEQHALTEDEKPFNQTVVYGVDVTVNDIVLECEQYPAFAERRVVIVKEAQNLGTSLKDLEAYAAKPSLTTVLVICYKYKSVDKRLKFVKSIEPSGGVVLESKKLYENQMPDWISMRANQYGFSIEAPAAALIAEHVGSNMSAAVKALEKVSSAVGVGLKTITVDMVSEHVGISKEYNAFELSEAIFKRDFGKAYKIVKVFGANPKQYPLPMISGALYSAFLKMFNYVYTMLTTNDPRQAMTASGEHSQFVIDTRYVPTVKNYNASQLMRALEYICDLDMRAKGYEWPESSNRDILIDLVARIASA